MCVCVCIWVCMHVCVYACMHACTYTGMHACMYTHYALYSRTQPPLTFIPKSASAYRSGRSTG